MRSTTLLILTTCLLSPVCLANVSVSKQEWMTEMQTALPPFLCDPKQYFRECFDVTETECVAATQIVVKGCLDSAAIGIPETLTAEDAETWSNIVGRCSLDLYQKYMHTKQRDLPKCQLPASSTSAPAAAPDAKPNANPSN